MKTIALSTYLQNPLTLRILSDMEMTVKITENKLNIPIDHLFNMAARINKKRAFLFVSKVLGKHIPVQPYIPLLTSGLLAIEYFERKIGKTITAKDEIVDGYLSQETEKLARAYDLLKSQKLDVGSAPIIIGFAETATALGHAVFDMIENAYYIPTTREEVNGLTPILNFEEEHSHAIDQLCYISADILKNERPIILVDDEITTGKTVINIIKEIQSTYPRKEYTVLSILDWRSEENQVKFKQLEKELDITITSVSLLAGQIEFQGTTLEDTKYDFQVDEVDYELNINHIDISSYFTPLSYQSKHNLDILNAFPYVKETGRFGISHEDRPIIDSVCKQAGERLMVERQGNRTLCLGTGELMYLPMKIATYMGEGISYHSTTRSPVHPVNQEYYAVKNGYKFNNPENQEVTHYVYNIPENGYDEVFLFFEGKVSNESLKPLYKWFKDRRINFVHIVTLSSELQGSGNDA